MKGNGDAREGTQGVFCLSPHESALDVTEGASNPIQFNIIY